jgi:hypothetical protein
MTTTAPSTLYVTPSCQLCGATSTVELTAAEVAAWVTGAPIQDAMPDRPAPSREQIRTGIHPQCWTAMFGHPETHDA